MGLRKCLRRPTRTDAAPDRTRFRLSTPERTAVLLTLAALAFVVVTLIGMAAERRGIHRAYQANTVKRRVLSFLVLASAILRRNALDLYPIDDLLESLARIPTKVSL